MVLSWLFSRGQPQLPKNWRNLVDSEALKIVEKLQKSGHEAYLVGGCVRDILLGKKPKDFDIATQATPQQVKALIHRSFIIGRRFRIVVAKRNDRGPPQIPGKDDLFPNTADRAVEREFQITTFRREPVIIDGVINENVFGSPREDALRRDFTINALFLDPSKNKIVDFVDGMKDLQGRKLRIIGDPKVRFKEDAIRILRALRFKSRTELKFEEHTLKAMKSQADELASAKRERLREEFLKVLREGHIKEIFDHFHELHIWKNISPALAKAYSGSHLHDKFLGKLSQALAKTPWTQTSQAPLIYLVGWPLNPAYPGVAHGSSVPLESFFEDIKVSKAEQEDMERIQASLLRLQKDPEAAQATRILARNSRFIPHQTQTFFCLKILAESHPEQFANLWKTWGPLWKTHIQDFVTGKLHAAHGGHEPRHTSSRGGTHPRSAAGESGRRRRRRPARRGASTAGSSEVS